MSLQSQDMKISPDGAVAQSPLKKGEQARITILEATRELVALKGPHATTVRDITEASGANVAAVNYYFHSKEELVRQAMTSITDALNAARLARLRSYEVAAQGQALAPEDILRALIEPVAEVSRARDGGSLYLRMIYQMRINPQDRFAQEAFDRNDHVAQAFLDAMGKTFAKVSREEIIWRYEFARGASIHMLADLDPLVRRMETLGHGAVSTSKTLSPEVFTRVIALLMGGFAA
ncbi:putative DNA-binding transcriptional regulator [Aquimixticola soesokkakensis]|uniref:Putative DNA-binding transcriptional regulator n=1 Tax=Aquimixticola soesokkakensis TaxID=1519096 RepID=A0A1Y5RSH2_9RHOB|nr:TetR family transcriptional regulator [Aquimixticola soesokkakensis]SLN23321.1 putative DNA-binding transcriptional regulator [Aquimixticola soesokkakensis]